MRLVSVRIKTALEASDTVRIEGRVKLDCGEEFEIWFETAEQLAADLSETGNPWIVAMLPYALSTGEQITCDIPADPALLENLGGLLSVWRIWYPRLANPEIIAPTTFASEHRTAGRSAAFFSGGVDSWFTVLRHAPERESNAVGNVDDLIAVHGFDIPLELPEEFAKLRARLSHAADSLNRELVIVKTNLRKTGSLWAKGWGWLTHGAGLAAVALILEKRYKKALIASSFPYASLMPWGSHPITDALFSTRSLEIKHDGAAYDRVAKTTLIARHKVALSNLHVCYRTGSASNCGRCAKCLRTMTTLQLLGALEGCDMFPTALELDKLARVYIEDWVDAQFFREILAFALRLENRAIARAVSRAIRRSDRLRPAVKGADKLRHVPLIWRLGPRIRQWLLR